MITPTPRTKVINNSSPWGRQGGAFAWRAINDLDIVDVARKLNMTMEKKGSKMKAKCLWHDDDHPSMIIGGGRNICKCFACDESANVIKLIRQSLNCSFKEACQWAVENFPNEKLVEGDGWKREAGWRLRQEERLQARRKAPQPPKGESLVCFRPEVLCKHDAMSSSFARCMAEVFGDAVAREVVTMYRLGSMPARWRYPDVMFPNIDVDGNIIDIKIQAYECDNRSDRFFHCLRNVCYWLKSPMMRREDIDRSKVFEMVVPHSEQSTSQFLPFGEARRGSCLFGEHLLRQHPDKVVALVESPKNACVGAAAYPEYLWLATGNKTMLKREVLEVLRGKRVVAFPDEDAFDEWKEKLRHMRDIATFCVIHAPGRGEKRDIADWILASPCPSQGGGTLNTTAPTYSINN